MADPSRTLSLPFRVDPTGAIAFTESPADQLTQRVYGVISTQPGERIMRPDYGCNLRQFDFEVHDPFLEEQMFQVMFEAVQRWEPDAIIVSVKIESPPGDDGVMPVTVFYRPSALAIENNPGVQLSAVRLGVVAESGAVREATL